MTKFNTPNIRDRHADVANEAQSIASRRSVLMGGAAAGLGASLGLLGARAFGAGLAPAGAGPLAGFDPFKLLCRTAASASAPAIVPGPARKLKLTWNATAICTAPVLVAAERGIFAKHNLDVELINFGGSTDQLLEALATGKADLGVGMALRWLKPLEQGFDVKITAGTHGGCMRLLVGANSDIKDLKSLKGKTIAVADLTSPGKNFFSIMLKKEGVDPNTEIDWRQFPGELLDAAVAKGEAHALIDGDPKTFTWIKSGKLRELASNLDGEYKDRTCCILGARGSLVRDEPLVAKAATQAILEAARYTVENPADAARLFAPNAPKTPIEDLEALVRYHTHDHAPVGDALKREIALYAEELKLVSVFKPTTNPAKFAERICADVLSA